MKQFSFLIALILFASTTAFGQINTNTPTLNNTTTIKPKTPTIKKANIIKMKKDLKRGDFYQGGIIIHLWDNGNHGIICAPEDVGQYIWGKKSESGAPSVGSDEETNQNLVNELGAGEYAAKACADYKGGGYDDWFLPSRQQLAFAHGVLFKKGKGNFSYGFYWTINQSTKDRGFSTAWAVQFSRSNTNYYEKDENKSSKYHVRAVREF